MNKRIRILMFLFSLFLAACAPEISMATPVVADNPALVSYASPTATLASEVNASEPTETPLPLPTTTPIYVEIKAGDTLLVIATRFDITLDALLAANPGLDPQFLWVGAVIEIPHVDEEGAVVSAPQATAVPLPLAAPACVADAVGGVWCVVVVSNDRAFDMENVVVWVRLRNAGGEVVAQRTGTLLLNRLPAGEGWPILVHFPPPVAQWVSASAQLSAALPLADVGGRYLAASVADVDVAYGASGKAAEVSGRVMLAEGEGGAGAVFVMLVAYDAEGGVVGVARWTSNEVLAAGGGVAFSGWVYSLGAEIVEVVVFVEAIP